MNYFIPIFVSGVSVILIGLFVYYFILDRKKLDKEIENYIVQTPPKLFLVLVIFWAIPALLLIFLNLFTAVAIWVNIFLSVFFAYLSSTLITYRERIEVLGEKIIYTPPFFGKPKIYDFNQITKIIKEENRFGMCSCKIYVGKKMIFSIENTLKNGIKFLNKTIGYDIQIEERRKK